MADILVQKDPNTLVPKLGISAAERTTWALDFTIYDINADGTKGAAVGPTRTKTNRPGNLTVDAYGATKISPTGDASPVSQGGNAFALSLGYNAAAIDVVVSSEAPTIATGPSTDANTNAELATMRAAYPGVVTFNEAAGGIVNATKYLLMPGSIPINSANNGVLASGEAWPGNASLYWKNGLSEVGFDGQEIAILFYLNGGASTIPILVMADDKPIAADSISLISTASANKDRWVTVAFGSAMPRTISISGGQIKEIRWKGTSYKLYKPLPRQRVAEHGDSFRTYEAQVGESITFLGLVHVNRAAAMQSRVWGLPPPITSCRGGTGILQDNGQEGNYLKRLTLEAGDTSVALHRIWGSTNDTSQDITAYKVQLNALLDLSKVKFPNAKRVVYGLLDWSSVGSAGVVAANLPYNLALAEVCAARGDTLFIPQGVSQRADEGYIYGTGRVNSTTGDGNADIYLGSAGSGVDRHWNIAGKRYHALRMSREERSRLIGG